MDNIEMIPVISTHIESIGFDDDNAELHIVYQRGGRYIYSGVPRVLFDEFLVAPSKAQFCDQQIKKAGFPYRRG